jgi:ATP adenylyltransferase
MTHEWLLIVPRTREVFEGISVNALGFAGSLFVRDDSAFAVLESAGPMAALRQVAAPRPGR